MADRFRESYGERPLHLLAVITTLAIVGYAVLEIADRDQSLNVAIWFVAAIIVHDAITFPLYSLLGLIAGGAAARGGDRGRGALNYVRIPAILSGLALIVWFPLILGLSEDNFQRASGRSTDIFLGRWLLLCAALFGISALLYAISSRRAAKPQPASPQAGA